MHVVEHSGGSGAIWMNPAAVRMMLQRYDTLADELDTLAAQQSQVLTVAAAGDGEGFLSGGISTGYASVQQIRTAAADLRQLVQNAALTVQQFEQVDTAFLLALGLPGSAPGLQTMTPDPATAMVEVDEQALAMLAYRLGEQGRSPMEIEQLVAAARLSQLQRALEAFGSRDFAQELADAEALEAAAQAQLDHFIDRELVSALAPTDKDLARYLAWLGLQQARAERAAVLDDWAQATETELTYLTFRRQQLAAEGTSRDALAGLDARIAALRADLDGDPAIAARITVVEQELADLQHQGSRGRPNAYAQQLRALRDELAALQEEGKGLRMHQHEAQEALVAATAHLDEATTTLQTTLQAYQEDLATRLPAQQTTLARLRTDSMHDPAWTPELAAAVDAVEQALTSRDPAVLQAALDQLDAATIPGTMGNAWVANTIRMDVLSGDPRLAVLAGRERFASQEAHPWMDELMLDLVTMGVGPLLVNQQKLNEPGGSDVLYQQLRGEQAVNATLLLVGFLGPLGAGGKQGLRLSDEAIQTLRTAGYSDEMIAAATRAVTAGHDEMTVLRQLVYTSDADDLLRRLQVNLDEMTWRVHPEDLPSGSGGKVLASDDVVQEWFADRYGNSTLSRLPGQVVFGEAQGLNLDLVGADQAIMAQVLDTLDILAQQNPEVAMHVRVLRVPPLNTQYPDGTPFRAYAAAIADPHSRLTDQFWFSEEFMRTGRLPLPADVALDSGRSIAFPTKGADTVNMPGLMAHEYGHAMQRWLETNGFADELKDELEILIVNHEPTLRMLTDRSFDYKEHSIPREVFAELYASRYVLDALENGTLAEDLVHPALYDPAVQQLVDEFGVLIDDMTQRARSTPPLGE